MIEIIIESKPDKPPEKEIQKRIGLLGEGWKVVSAVTTYFYRESRTLTYSSPIYTTTVVLEKS